MSTKTTKLIPTTIDGLYARIITKPTAGKLLLRGYALDANGRRVESCQTWIQKLVPSDTPLDTALAQVCNLIEADYRTKVLASKRPVSQPGAAERHQLGIFSASYHSLPDPKVLYAGWAPSTTRQTESYLLRQVLPRMDEYGEAITDAAMQSIAGELTDHAQANKRGGHSRTQAEHSTVNALGRIDTVLERLYVYYPGLPQVRFSQARPKKVQRELAKALPVEIRLRLTQALLHLKGTALATGVAMMFLLGLRTAEAAGVRIGDLRFHLYHGRPYVTYFVSGQAHGGVRTEILKTAAGYRRVVGGPLLTEILQARIDALRSAGYTSDEIASMPLLASPDDPYQYADDQKLSAYAKQLLQFCGYTENYFSSAADLMVSEPDVVDGERTTDLSAYILRRDWCSRLANIAGITSADLDYMLGHKRRDQGNSHDFLSDSECLQILHQLERCVLSPDHSLHPLYSTQELILNAITDLTGHTSYRIHAPITSPVTVKLKVALHETSAPLTIITTGKTVSAIRNAGTLIQRDHYINKPIALPPYEAHLYEAAKVWADNINFEAFT